MDPETAAVAAAVERRADSDHQHMRAEQLRRANQHILVGALVLAIGLLVTVGSFFAAGPGNAHVVTVGALVFGAITLGRGLVARSDLNRR